MGIYIQGKLKKSCFLISILLCFIAAQGQETKREQWLHYMDKVSRPILSNLAKDKLKEVMPIVLSEAIDNPEHRTEVAYLEAFARALSGISPWLNLEGGSPEEIALRKQYRKWTLKAVANSVNPKAKDYLIWTGGQPLVDASFFALALNRCPWIWKNLDETVRNNVIRELKSSRKTIPPYTNWILFTGMVEAFFSKHNIPYDAVRVEYGIREFSQHWYAGDGMFTDGVDFALDYYNSYVIQPYLVNILASVDPKNEKYDAFLPKLEKITTRYAEIQERSINADGSFPIFGRSIVYRSGAFHHLADVALREKLPENLKPAQVREGLFAVIQKTLNAPNTFNKEGYLTIGLYGPQPKLADFYINTGSLYLCSAVFLPLGLPADNAFWTDEDAPWTSKKVWSGIDVPADHGIHID